MGWFSGLISGGVGDLVDAGVKIFDDLHLSGEEKAQAELKLRELTQSFEEKILAASVDYEKQVTERHANDMKSDSWWSKNIRPMTLAFTGIALIVMAFASIFFELTENQIQVVQVWSTPLISLYGLMVSFYFGSRGIEKVKQIGQ